MDSLDVSSLKKFIESNPDLMNKIVGYKKPGVPKGTKKPIQPVVVETEAPEVEEISYSKAKKMGIIKRKPRNLSDESKQRMLDNLAKGREALKAYQEAKRKVKEDTPTAPTVTKIKEKSIVEDDTKPTKKYLVKPPKRRVKKEIPLMSDTDEEDTTTATDITESETTDVETRRIRKKVAKKQAVLDTIDKQLQKIPPPTQLTRQSKYGKLF